MTNPTKANDWIRNLIEQHWGYFNKCVDFASRMNVPIGEYKFNIKQRLKNFADKLLERHLPTSESLIEEIMREIESDFVSTRTWPDIWYIEYSKIRGILTKHLTTPVIWVCSDVTYKDSEWNISEWENPIEEISKEEFIDKHREEWCYHFYWFAGELTHCRRCWMQRPTPVSEWEVCKSCYWKKQFSVFHQDNSKDDFTGKDVGKGKSWTTLETCKRCNGTGEEPVYKPEDLVQIWDVREDMMASEQPKQEIELEEMYSVAYVTSITGDEWIINRWEFPNPDLNKIIRNIKKLALAINELRNGM